MEGHDPLLTTAEVAALFRVDPRTVRRWVRAKRLTEIPTPGGLPRYRTSEVRALLPYPETTGPAVPPGTPTPAGPVPAKRTGRACEEHP